MIKIGYDRTNGGKMGKGGEERVKTSQRSVQSLPFNRQGIHC